MVGLTFWQNYQKWDLESLFLGGSCVGSCVFVVIFVELPAITDGFTYDASMYQYDFASDKKMLVPVEI